MSQATRIQIVGLLLSILALEALVRLGVIPRFTMIPPSEMATGLYRMFRTGSIQPDLYSTLTGVGIAAIAAIITGFIIGALIHRAPRLRQTLEPLFASYYAVPIWAFYPLFIVIFGLNDFPKVVIAYLYAVVAMIVNTLTGLDRLPAVYSKTARVMRMSSQATAIRIVVPAAAPYVFTGVKLAIAYSFIGVVGSEFILATSGLGYKIGFAYHDLDNQPLYSTILLILILSVAINLALFNWEKVLMKRRGLA
jgi:NitT/TauT family transport system permease protein